MSVYDIQMFLIVLLLTSIFGYILVVLKEKIYLKDNVIMIEKESVTQDFLDKADIKVFMLGDEELKTGDEIKLITSNNKQVEGIILGAIMKDNEIILVTHKDEVKKLKVDTIRKIKVVSKYGMFFKAF